MTKDQLDRIEQKLDRLLELLGSKPLPLDERLEQLKIVYATGGVKGLKEYMRNYGHQNLTQRSTPIEVDRPERLHPDDIAAIAAEVVRQMQQQDIQRTDAAYLATLPIEDVKKIQREKMRLENEKRRAVIKRSP